MWGNVIARRVWKAIKAKIRAAQREYEEQCKHFETEREQAIKQAETDCENKKITLADKLVKDIIG